jgi:hypothetical protein
MKLELREFVGWQVQSGATSREFIWVRLIKLDKNKLSEHQIIHFVLCEFKKMDCLYVSNFSAI